MTVRPKGVVLHVAKFLDGLDRQCDHDCVFCMERMEPGGSVQGFPTLQMMHAALSDAVAHCPSISTVYIAGGEPTKRPDILDIVRAARQYVAQVHLSTHGDYLDPDKIAIGMGSAGLTNVALSLHGPNAELHDWHTRSPGSFSRTTATLQAFAAEGIAVRLNCVVTSHNVDHLGQVVNFVSDSFWGKVEELCFTHYLNKGNAYFHPELGLKIDEVAGALAWAIDCAASTGLTVQFRDFPLCLDPRLVHLNNSVDEIAIIRWQGAGGYLLLPEKAPAVWRPCCDTCELREPCPGFLKANYG